MGHTRKAGKRTIATLKEAKKATKEILAWLFDDGMIDVPEELRSYRLAIVEALHGDNYQLKDALNRLRPYILKLATTNTGKEYADKWLQSEGYAMLCTIRKLFAFLYLTN